MTIQQICLAVMIAEKGSVSAASLAMRISQPNASQALKKLEDELGYAIFRRAEGGMIPTERGYRFLEHAEKIRTACEAIRAGDDEKSVPRLRLGIMNYTPAAEAFVDFCEELRGENNADLTCVNVSPEDGARLLKERALDLIVSLQMKSTLPAAEKLCREYMLEMNMVAMVPVCVRVRRDHPLILSGELDGSAGGFRKLSRYPYVEYRDLEHILPAFVPAGGAPFGYTYKIYTDERESRLSIVGRTDAYTVGCAISAARAEQYGLAVVPIRNEKSSLVTFSRKGDLELPGVRRYMELLKKQLVDDDLV